MWGANGVVAAQALAGALITLNMMGLAGRMIGASIASQLGAAWRALLAGALAAGVLLAIRPLADGVVGARLLAALALCGAGALVAYAAGLLALWLATGRPEGIEATLISAVAQRAALAPPARAGSKGPAEPDEVARSA